MKRNIINLSRIFINENIKRTNIIKDKKVNKKSLFFWVFLILFIGISWISIEFVKYCKGIGKPEIFLNFYLLFVEILVIIQSILLSANMFYFSKETENILYMPFKPVEVLISKFIGTISNIYLIELIFALFPFLIYGIYTDKGILFYFNLIVLLIVFPLFIFTFISIINFIFMKFLKILKNKEIVQLIIAIVLIICLLSFLNYSITNIITDDNISKISGDNIDYSVVDALNNKLIDINKLFLTVNPVSEILQNNNIIINYIKLIILNLIVGGIFIFIGNKYYLKQLLKNSFYIKNKIIKEKNIDKKIKAENRTLSYIKKEINTFIKNPLFFLQIVYPVILTTLFVCVLFFNLTPSIVELLNKEEYKEMMNNLKFDFEAVCLIIGIIQIVGLLNYSSVTSFSREGKNAFFIKTIPIDLFKQFVFKNIPQILINTVCAIFILGVIKYEIPVIEYKYIFIILGLSIILFIINSFILSIIDLLNPKLNWDVEFEVLQNNKNKLLQYVLIIFNIIFLYYFNKFFEGKNLDFSIIIFGIFLLLILLIFNIILIKFKNKLFKKIN